MLDDVKILDKVSTAMSTLQGEYSRKETELKEISINTEAVIRTELQAINKNRGTSTGEIEMQELLKESLTLTKQKHYKYDLAHRVVMLDIPLWLYGTAGTGKTTLCQQIATGLKLSFHSISLCPTTSKSDFLGYRDAVGEYHSTSFREAFEHGGVFCFEEIDNGHPSTLSLLNSAIGNGFCTFPDGEVAKHKSFRVVATANTTGAGGSIQYLGRNRIDAATKDRFAFLEIPIDTSLEKSLIDIPCEPVVFPINDSPSKGFSMDKFYAWVVKCRELIAAQGLEALVTPRALLYAKKLTLLNVRESLIKELVVYKGDSKLKEKLESL